MLDTKILSLESKLQENLVSIQLLDINYRSPT